MYFPRVPLLWINSLDDFFHLMLPRQVFDGVTNLLWCNGQLLIESDDVLYVNSSLVCWHFQNVRLVVKVRVCLRVDKWYTSCCVFPIFERFDVVNAYSVSA